MYFRSHRFILFCFIFMLVLIVKCRGEEKVLNFHLGFDLVQGENGPSAMRFRSFQDPKLALRAGDDENPAEDNQAKAETAVRADSDSSAEKMKKFVDPGSDDDDGSDSKGDGVKSTRGLRAEDYEPEETSCKGQGGKAVSKFEDTHKFAVENVGKESLVSKGIGLLDSIVQSTRLFQEESEEIKSSTPENKDSTDTKTSTKTCGNEETVTLNRQDGKYLQHLKIKKLELEVRRLELEVWEKERHLGVEHSTLTDHIKLLVPEKLNKMTFLYSTMPSIKK